MNAFVLFLSKSYVTCAGIGFVPKGPGTAASAVALLFWIALYRVGVSIEWMAALIALKTILAGPAVRYYERSGEEQDRSEIVIDEWVGMGIALLPTNFELIQSLAAFTLFRIFDIRKPWGVRYFDNNYLKGWGVILDDVIAGIYAALAILLYRWLLKV